MIKDERSFQQWLETGRIASRRLSPELRSVLQAVFSFLQRCGRDYASQRMAAHFLLHCELGLKRAQVARLIGVTRPTASRQSKLSSRDVVREIQHRLSGRPYGKLLPRHAGPIAEYLITHPRALRADVLDFIERTFQVRVSTVALHHFLKKYGLDKATRAAAAPAADPPPAGDQALIEVLAEPAPPPALPADEFFLPTRSTPAPFC
jgi:hypothetical protein